MIGILLRFWIPLVLLTIYAVRKGGAPERYAAAFYCIAACATVLARPGHARYAHLAIGVMVVDAVFFAGLVWLTIKAARNWPIAAAVLQAVTLVAHLGKAEDHNLWRMGYFLALTLPVPGILASLAVGTWTHQRRIRMHGTDPSWRT